MYSTGRLEYPAEDDPRFDTEEEAIKAAIQASFDDSPHGVWHDADGELLHIVYFRSVYSA